MTTAAGRPARPRPRRSRAPTSAARPGSPCPAARPARASSDDLWDFTEVVGLPVQMALVNRRFDFAAIADPRWRLVAKERSWPCSPRGTRRWSSLPRAYRTPLHLRSCSAGSPRPPGSSAGSPAQGISHLAQTRHAGLRGIPGPPPLPARRGRHRRRRAQPGDRRAAAQVVVDLVNHRDLFTADQRPGRPATRGAERPPRRSPRCRTERPAEQDPAGRRRGPAADARRRAAPGDGARPARGRTADRQVRRPALVSSDKADMAAPRHRCPRRGRQECSNGTTSSRGEPLPLLEDHHVIQDRIDAGWPPGDPLLPARHRGPGPAGRPRQFWASQMPALRARCEDAVAPAGAQKTVRPQRGRGPRPPTAAAPAVDLAAAPVQAVALVGIVRTAAIIVLAAASGMRASELMELRVGCRRPAGEPVPACPLPARQQDRQGPAARRDTDDEWVVVEPAYRAVELAEQLHDDPRAGRPAAGRFDFDRPLHLVQELGQLPGRAAARARPDPGRPGRTSGCCGRPWPSRWPTGPAASSPPRST